MKSKPKTTCAEAGHRGGSVGGPAKRRSFDHYHKTGVMGSHKRWGGPEAAQQRAAERLAAKEEKLKAAIAAKINRKIAREQRKIATIQSKIETLEVLLP